MGNNFSKREASNSNLSRAHIDLLCKVDGAFVAAMHQAEKAFSWGDVLKYKYILRPLTIILDFWLSLFLNNNVCKYSNH